jgi:hypothetical protein
LEDRREIHGDRPPTYLGDSRVFGGSTGTPPASPPPTTIQATSTVHGIQTRAETVRQALVDHGYTELEAAPDETLDDAGQHLCDFANVITTIGGDPLLRKIGKGLAQGLNSEMGTTYTADDGAVIAEFVTVYCPEVLEA